MVQKAKELLYAKGTLITPNPKPIQMTKCERVNLVPECYDDEINIQDY
jgi:hypothetical protein